tara:strand:- start:26 stop:586 length:561 start_codon:yes stop_codon:yes gene_type:complete
MAGCNRILAGTLASAVAAAGMAGPALAQTKDRDNIPTSPPAIYTDLLACKDISDATARLACYDERVAALQTAQSTNQVVIADREQVREARRGLFGLSLPQIKLFGGDESEGVSELSAVVQTAKRARNGKWFFVLEDGAKWIQTDNTRIYPYPDDGSEIIIKRAALGSFAAQVGGSGRSFKIKRIVD